MVPVLWVAGFRVRARFPCHTCPCCAVQGLSLAVIDNDPDSTSRYAVIAAIEDCGLFGSDTSFWFAGEVGTKSNISAYHPYGPFSGCVVVGASLGLSVSSSVLSIRPSVLPAD
jgi:hypothetical protein